MHRWRRWLSFHYLSLGNIQVLSGRKSETEAAVPSSKGQSVLHTRPVPLLQRKQVLHSPSAGRAAAGGLTPGPPRGRARGRGRGPSSSLAGRLAPLRLRRRRGFGVGLRNGGLHILQPAAGRRHPEEPPAPDGAAGRRPGMEPRPALAVEGRQEEGRGGRPGSCGRGERGSEARLGVTAPSVTLVDTGARRGALAAGTAGRPSP